MGEKENRRRPSATTRRPKAVPKIAAEPARSGAPMRHPETEAVRRGRRHARGRVPSPIFLASRLRCLA